MNESKATRYQRRLRRLRAASAGSALVVLGLVALTPLAPFLRNWAEAAMAGLGRMTSGAALVVFVGALVLLCEVAGLAAAAWVQRPAGPPGRQPAERTEGLLTGRLQAGGVMFLAAVALGGAVRLSTALAGAWWWLVAGPLVALLLAGAMWIAPLLFSSLGRVRPLARPVLTDRLSALAARAGVPVAAIDEWIVDDSAEATALVTGVGRGRRVLVSSAIARHWSDDEVAVVVAHELAHCVYRDLWRTFALHSCVVWLSLLAGHLAADRLSGTLGIAGPGDLAALPLLGLVSGAVWAAATPLRHAQSRRHERRADAFALELTGAVDAFGTAIARLGAARLAEERPSVWTRWFYHRHPPVAERLALAESFRTARVAGARPARSAGASAVRR